jgi:DNA-binding transcriptional regulator YhcF (GntR family)
MKTLDILRHSEIVCQSTSTPQHHLADCPHAAPHRSRFFCADLRADLGSDGFHHRWRRSCGGEFVPSVRDLSQQLIINPNTVTRAYQELERLGVLEARRGLGMAITAEAPKLCRERRKTILRDSVRETIREAATAGLSQEDFHQLIDDEWPAAIRGQKSPRAS